MDKSKQIIYTRNFSRKKTHTMWTGLNRVLGRATGRKAKKVKMSLLKEGKKVD